MVLQEFAGLVYRRFSGGDATDRGNSGPLSSTHKKKEEKEAKDGKTSVLLSRRDSGTVITGAPSSDDFMISHIETNSDRKFIAATQKTNGEQKSLFVSSNNNNNNPRSISWRRLRRTSGREDSIETKHNNSRGPDVSKSPSQPRRLTMSQKKIEAMAASVARMARNEVLEKRRKAYVECMAPLRMAFVGTDSHNTDDESFCEEFEKFLDKEQIDKEMEEQKRHNEWRHSFRERSDPNKKKKKKKQTKSKTKTKTKTKKQAKDVKNPGPSPSPSKSSASYDQARAALARRLFRQYMSFARNLPVAPEGSIFVRVHEQRLDLPRALITGPHGTPYANGLFFFDMWTRDYPNSPPKVLFLTTGNGKVRFNPNLYHSGKVCLSLLGTWQGPGWISGCSTLLQLLLSCQGLILGTDEPFFNEPGYEAFKGSPLYDLDSVRYNKNVRKQTLRWAILDPLRKVVLQEERTETRRQFVEKLKEQQRLKQRTSNDNEKDGDEDSSRTDSTQIQAPSPMGVDTKDKTESKKKRMKTKWRLISNLWSVLPQTSSPLPFTKERLSGEDKGETVPLLPSDMPPRQRSDYSEFSTVVIKHFVETADHMEEQLKEWHELDPKGTRHLVEDIRKWLKRLLDLEEARKSRMQQQKETSNVGGDGGQNDCNEATENINSLPKKSSKHGIAEF